MKEKLSLFIGLSLLICLTVYKKSVSNNIELSNSTSALEVIRHSEQNDNNEVPEDDVIINNSINESEAQCHQDEESINQLNFSDAFKYYRNCNYDIFKWNGLEYTTTLKVDSSEDIKNNKQTRKIDLVVN